MIRTGGWASQFRELGIASVELRSSYRRFVPNQLRSLRGGSFRVGEQMSKRRVGHHSTGMDPFTRSCVA